VASDDLPPRAEGQERLFHQRRAGQRPQLRQRDMHIDPGVGTGPVRHQLGPQQQLTPLFELVRLGGPLVAVSSQWRRRRRFASVMRLKSFQYISLWYKSRDGNDGREPLSAGRFASYFQYILFVGTACPDECPIQLPIAR
jgi:hypothetical protein